MGTQAIPLTHLAEYLKTAKEIQRAVRASAPAEVDLHQVVAALADLAVKALDEVHQSFEGLAILLMALHPEVSRSHRQAKV